MSVTLYALFPDRYVPQHAVLATRTHTPDAATVIVRKDGHKTHKVTYLERIAKVMAGGEPMTRAKIQEFAGVSRAAVVANLKKLISNQQVVVLDAKRRHPKYMLIK